MSGTTSPRKAARWRRRVILLMVFGPLLFFFGSNLLLGSGWGRERVARKMAAMTGFRWEVGGGSWSPWGGVRLRDLEARARVVSGPDPGPVLLVKEVRVRPYWTRLLGGELALREIVVEQPVADVPLELLTAMGPVGPAPARSMDGKVPGPQETPGSGEAQAPETGTAPAPDRPPAGEAAPAAPAGAPPELAKDSSAGGLPGVVRMSKGRLRLYSLKAPSYALSLDGIEVEAPFGGPEAEGLVETGPLVLGGNQLMPALRSKLSWKRPVLTMEPTEWKWEELPLRVEAQVVLGGRLRSGVELRVPSSVLKPVELPGVSSLVVSGGQVEMLVRLQGELLRPSGWEGSLLAGGRQLSVAHRGQTVLAFDYGRVVGDYRGGVIRVPDGRLVGETFSVLGNGAVHHQGGMLGVVRVIADWEYAAAVSRAAAGAGFNKGTLPWLAPLGTPDRYYRDIHIEGMGAEAMVDIGRQGEQVPAGLVMDRITRFARGEKWEEDHGEGHDPRWDGLLLQQ